MILKKKTIFCCVCSWKRKYKERKIFCPDCCYVRHPLLLLNCSYFFRWNFLESFSLLLWYIYCVVIMSASFVFYVAAKLLVFALVLVLLLFSSNNSLTLIMFIAYFPDEVDKLRSVWLISIWLTWTIDCLLIYPTILPMSSKSGAFASGRSQTEQEVCLLVQ